MKTLIYIKNNEYSSIDHDGKEKESDSLEWGWVRVGGTET